MASQYKNHEAIFKLNKTSTEQASYQKGRHFLAISRKIDTGFTCTRCSSVFQRLQMFIYKSDAT